MQLIMVDLQACACRKNCTLVLKVKKMWFKSPIYLHVSLRNPDTQLQFLFEAAAAMATQQHVDGFNGRERSQNPMNSQIITVLIICWEVLRSYRSEKPFHSDDVSQIGVASRWLESQSVY